MSFGGPVRTQIYRGFDPLLEGKSLYSHCADRVAAALKNDVQGKIELAFDGEGDEDRIQHLGRLVFDDF